MLQIDVDCIDMSIFCTKTVLLSKVIAFNFGRIRILY